MLLIFKGESKRGAAGTRLCLMGEPVATPKVIPLLFVGRAGFNFYADPGSLSRHCPDYGMAGMGLRPTEKGRRGTTQQSPDDPGWGIRHRLWADGRTTQ
jgi:hypothetical protein